MRVLVTGGLGYIGSHACCQLTEKGAEVVTFDNLSRGNMFAAQFGENFEGDLASIEDVTACFDTLGPFDAVMHFAALAYVGESVEMPFEYYVNNVEGTRNLLNVMEKNGCHKIIFSSSCAVYGTPNRIPVSENENTQPESPYGLTKLMCEHEIQYKCNSTDLKAICLRYFNVIGSDPKSRVGESHNPETHLVPNLIEAAVKNQKFQLFGVDYDTYDGTNIRDYIDVNDLAEIHVLSLKKFENIPDSKFITINVGTGNPISNLQMIKSVEEVTGQMLQVEYCPRRIGDAVALHADNGLMRKFFPEKTTWKTLHESVTDAYQWRIKNEGP